MVVFENGRADIYRGNGVFDSLSNYFHTTLENPSVPESSTKAIATNTVDTLKKVYFHLPLWAWILIIVAIIILLVVML